MAKQSAPQVDGLRRAGAPDQGCPGHVLPPHLPGGRIAVVQEEPS